MLQELQTKLVEEHGIEISVRSINRDLKLLIEAGEVEAMVLGNKQTRGTKLWKITLLKTYRSKKDSR